MSRGRIIAWVDCETSGRGLNDPIIEFAMVLTDQHLAGISGASLSLIIKPDEDRFPGWRDNMSPEVRKMHTSNGLLGGVSMGFPLRDAENAAVDLIERHREGREVCAAGRGIERFDLPLLRRAMPRLYRTLHPYRTYDVLYAARIARDFASRGDLQPSTKQRHRALDDVRCSISEASMIRAALS